MTNHNINNKTKKEIRRKKENKCEDCGRLNGPIDIPDERLQIHHKVPRWKGGTNKITNLKLLCKDCHDKAHRQYHKEKLKNIRMAYEKLIVSGQYEC